jgi:thiol-disulfide isomerase/thioredoxin
MKMQMLKRIFITSLVASLLLAGCTDTGAKSEVPAADFALQDLQGKTVRLSDFRGKVVLIDFWATWCPPCRAAIPNIEKIHKEYKRRGLVVLAISMDDGDWDMVRSFAKSYGMTYMILKGTNDVAAKYGVRSIPMTILLDKSGRIAKREFGYANEEDIEKAVKAVL